MRRYVLQHRHTADECAAAFAAWRSFQSPLRQRTAPCTCLADGHAIWWFVDAPDAQAALDLLPPFVRTRTEPVLVRDVLIP